ncbi:MAG: HAMP domain-containing histidine kinase [Eubacterium sp.]|nr:HAMP domain-containing histidine kinase [Eubacterium sp.]
MKRLAKLYIFVVLLFLTLFVAANLLFASFVKKSNEASNILMNRVVDGIHQKYIMSTLQYSYIDPIGGGKIQKIIDSYMEEERPLLEKEYGKSALPDDVVYISVTDKRSANESLLLNKENTRDKVWKFYGGDDTTLIGFLIFRCKEKDEGAILLLLNVCLAIAFLIAIGICIYISSAVLRPFEKLSDYPEKLSKSEITEKLPETKNRMFGRFIWGLNMLSDNMQNKQRKVDELSRDQMTMLTTIAHGIKTPVANIKLYADAIRTGLYQENGKINKSDAEIAGKISKNADDITEIVKELIDRASGTVVEFEPDIESFYIEELKTFLEEEYSNRLKMNSIPYSFEVSHNAIVKSDKSGICRILSQIMENAIKYGNGEGIHVSLSKEEDGYYFVIRNKGQVLSEKELPYIFNSFWRGSNAESVGGSGIGLFEAKKIAQYLYGDIYVKANPDENEMEFDIYIPENV